MIANDIVFDKHKGEVFTVDQPSLTDRVDSAGWVHGDRITVVKALSNKAAHFQLLNLDLMETSLYGSVNSNLKVVPLAHTQPPSDGFWSDKAKLYNALTLDQRLEFEKAFNSAHRSVYVNSVPPNKIISCAFAWNETPQGHNYWSDIRDKLERAGL